MLSWLRCVADSDFMTNVVIVFIIFPLLDQGLGLPGQEGARKIEKLLHENKDGGSLLPPASSHRLDFHQ